MTSIVGARDDAGPARYDPGSKRLRRLVKWLIIGAFVGFVLWFLLGMLGAALGVKSAAGHARTELNAFKASLLAGDDKGADQHLADAQEYMRQATASSDNLQVRIAGHLPLLDHSVHDMRHLVVAGNILTGVAQQAAHVYADFSGPNSSFFDNGVFNIALVHQATAKVAVISSEIDAARSELAKVKGGFFSPGASDAKADALTQMGKAQQDIDNLEPLLAALPSAIGEDGPRAYLVVVLNPGELRAGGGAPLSMALINIDHGKVLINHRGQTYDTAGHNRRYNWDPVPGDAYASVGPNRFVNANFNPDWSVSGEELARAFQAMWPDVHVDGVIGIDPIAIKNLLKVTGPVDIEGYGKVSTENLVQVVLKDAYLDVRNFTERHDLNNALMDVMIKRLMSGGGTIGKARALGDAAPAHHLQMYFRQPALQALVLKNHLGGVLTHTTGDYASSYTRNTNASKLDVYQQVNISQDVVLNADGSADVTRTMVVENNVPPAPDGNNANFGYLATVAEPYLSMYIPGAATDITDVNGNTMQTINASGYLVAQREVTIGPGESATFVVHYRIPHALTGDGSWQQYTLDADPQAVVNPTKLAVTVHLPGGWNARSAAGFTVNGNTATASVVLDQARHLALDAHR